MVFTIDPSHRVSVRRHALFFFMSASAILIVVAAMHPYFNIGDPDKELKQIVSRISYIAYFVVVALIIRSWNMAEQAWHWAKQGLKLAFLYGLYQFAAGFLGLPLFLDFLRNSKSFLMTENYQGGWIDTFRAFSIWSEPSQAAVPVGIFLYMLYFKTNNGRERKWWLSIVTIFSVVTFSRVVWVVWIASLATIGLMRSRRTWARSATRIVFRYRYALVLLLVVVLMQWAMLVPKDEADSSAETRSSTVLMGERLFLEHPVLGTGFNSFAKLSDSVATAYSEEDLIVVHNLFVSYAQQLGIFGVVLSLLPVGYVLWMPNAPAGPRLFVAFLFVLVGSLGGDFFYAPFGWFILGLFAAEDVAPHKVFARAERTAATTFSGTASYFA
jgi:hypothetical protein